MNSGGRARDHGCVAATIAVVLGIALLVPPFAMADTAADAAPPAPPKDVADMDLAELVKVRVTPFDVATRLDKGYRASNSVSGSRFDAPIGDLPFAIQAFTESFIVDQQPRDIFDVARYSPGVTYRSNDFVEGNANLAIRGFAISSAPSGFQVLRDGLGGPPIFDFTNISRVEVVKGPASFLYGQVAPGGIVNVITKKPQAAFAASAEARYGSYDQYRFDVDVTGPLAKTLFVRVPASYDHDIHYWQPYDAHSWDAAPTLLWQPMRRLSVSLSYERYHKYESPPVMQKPGYNTQAGLVPTPSDPNKSGVDVPGLPDDWNSMAYRDYRRNDTSGLNAWIDLVAGDHWNLRTGYSHLDYEIELLFSGNLGMANNNTLLQGRRFAWRQYTQVSDTWELGGVGNYLLGPVSLRLLLGAQVVKRRFDAAFAQAPADPALGNDPIASPLPRWDLGDPTTWNRDVNIPMSGLTDGVTAYDVRYLDVSGLAGTTFGFFDDRLLLLAGWRFTSTQSQQTNHLTGQIQPEITASVVTPQYGALYKLVPGLSLFASYAESFVPGATVLVNNVAPEPTRGRGYDAGIKADLLGGRVSGTVSVFEIWNKNIVTDLATTNASGLAVTTPVQSGEQRSQGVEVDATVTATTHWQLYLSYSYMDARITEFTGNDSAILAQDPTTLDAAGKTNYKNASRYHNAPLQMSAPHIANLWTSYRLSKTRLRGLYVAGGLNYLYDQTLLPDTPPSAHQTYALLNATIGYAHAWRGHRMDLHVMGKNLANEHYRPSQSTRGRPREILLTLRASF